MPTRSNQPPPSALNAEVGSIVRGLIARRGTDQKTVAAALHVSTAHISRLLNNTRHWELELLDAACTHLGANTVAVIDEAERAVRGNVLTLVQDADQRGTLHQLPVAANRYEDETPGEFDDEPGDGV